MSKTGDRDPADRTGPGGRTSQEEGGLLPEPIAEDGLVGTPDDEEDIDEEDVDGEDVGEEDVDETSAGGLDLPDDPEAGGRGGQAADRGR